MGSVPRQVLDYKVGTRSPLDWVVDRYQVKTDKDSGIVNDPKEWESSAEGVYSIDLSRKLIEMTLQTQKIIAGLPKESFIRN